MRDAPSIVPETESQAVHFVLEDLGGRFGLVWRETDPERGTRARVVSDMLNGEYGRVVRIVALDLAAMQVRDASADIARDVAARCRLSNEPLPVWLSSFMQRHAAE